MWSIEVVGTATLEMMRFLIAALRDFLHKTTAELPGVKLRL